TDDVADRTFESERARIVGCDRTHPRRHVLDLIGRESKTLIAWNVVIHWPAILKPHCRSLAGRPQGDEHVYSAAVVRVARHVRYPRARAPGVRRREKIEPRCRESGAPAVSIRHAR